MESQKENLSREIKKLEEKLEERDDEIWQMKNSLKSVASSAGKNAKQDVSESLSPLASVHVRKPNQVLEDNRIDVTNMIREEGEVCPFKFEEINGHLYYNKIYKTRYLQGSEWVEPHLHQSPRQQLYNPPSLEQLINSSFPSQSQPVDESSSIISAATDNSNREIAKLESKV